MSSLEVIRPTSAPTRSMTKTGVVIHHMEGNTDPNLVGQDYIRYYELEGDKLVLTVANQAGGKLAPKSPNSLRLVWRRVKC